MGLPVYLNRVSTAVPENEAHQLFIQFISEVLPERERKLFLRLAKKAAIETRYSVLKDLEDYHRPETPGFYKRGRFPTTEARMKMYEQAAPQLAFPAVERLFAAEGSGVIDEITHVLVSSCTGFYAPGLDLQLVQRFGLNPRVERAIIGFMGCYAGFNCMRNAYHIVRSNPRSRVLVVNLELCSLHMQEDASLEKMLGFMQFADGCAASLISAEPRGLELREFATEVISDQHELIRWHIVDQGFSMFLDTMVPQAIGRNVPDILQRLGNENWSPETPLWAVHPGGRSILDSVQEKLQLSDEKLCYSRRILRDFGNMSSATIMFVLKDIMDDPAAKGRGCAMAFGPGLTVELMAFNKWME